jgi:hypothetical protein
MIARQKEESVKMLLTDSLAFAERITWMYLPTGIDRDGNARNVRSLFGSDNEMNF